MVSYSKSIQQRKIEVKPKLHHEENSKIKLSWIEVFILNLMPRLHMQV